MVKKIVQVEKVYITMVKNMVVEKGDFAVGIGGGQGIKGMMLLLVPQAKKKNQETENETLFVEELVEFSQKFIEKEKYTRGKEEKEIAEEGENMTDGKGDGRKDGSAAEKTR